MTLSQRILSRFKRGRQTWNNHQRIAVLSKSVKPFIRTDPNARPVVFFNASTRLAGLSLNAAYSLLASFGVQLEGAPVIHFVCRAGMSRCVLGTNRDDFQEPPPCDLCINNSKGIFNNSEIQWFEYIQDDELKNKIDSLGLKELLRIEQQGVPLGQFALPSLRWILRRHNLLENENTRALTREYILSGSSIAREFQAFIQTCKPQAVVVFNGMFYPEAIVRWVAFKQSIPVYTHEVGMQPYSTFFTAGDATAYPVDISADFKLSAQQEKRLDDYLDKRFQGDFLTAGIRFWPEMHELGEEFWQKAAKFKQFVPIFTNVVFDTSQSHANQVFPHMFVWLDLVLEEIHNTPETLFVIRAHPDELRPGKESRESVADWVEKKHVIDLQNAVFIHPNEYVSSYQLIEHAKFVMVYNSTVGLEATIKGKPVLCAGKARYTQVPIVEFPQSKKAYQVALQKFLKNQSIPLPAEFIRNARHVLYSQLFMASLPFENFIESDGVWNGFVRIKDFPLGKIDPRNSKTMKTVVDGILHQGDFLLEP